MIVKKITALLMASLITLSIPNTALAYSSSSNNSRSTVTISNSTIYTGIVTSNKLNIRSSNSTSSEILGSLRKNDTVKIIKKTRNDWYEIKFKDNTAYISSKYVTITSNYLPPYALKSTDKFIGTAIVRSNTLSVRRGSSTKYSKVGILKKNDAVKIISKLKNGWYRVTYQDGYGYINGNYTLSLTDTSDNAQEEYLRIQEILIKNSNSITKLVNRNNPLKANYKPSDLVKPSVSATKTIYLRKTAATALEKLFKAAKKANINISAVSGFRSSSYQSTLYNNSLIVNGYDYTNKFIAKPNYSEHQTGLAIDISAKSVGYDLVEHFESTKEGKWLAKNVHKYGFILRYKKDRINDTGYGIEPWHFRYVGTDVAKYINENNLILEDLYK